MKVTVYDIEMQVSNTGELPKRSRYYQSMIDLQLIDKGQHYKNLNRSYIIFICPIDAFGKGRHIYTFESVCKEDNSVFLGDEAVKEAKKNREWRHEYMTLLMRDQENQEIGEKKMAKLVMLLNEDGRISDIVKVSQDKEYRQKLYAEYHIV